jgi:hypothetical protein
MSNYYDSLIKQTKRYLPEWLYNDLQKVARPQVVASDNGPLPMNVLEKIGIEGIGSEALGELSKEELEALASRVNEIFNDPGLQKEVINDTSVSVSYIIKELQRREIPIDESSEALNIEIEPKEKPTLWSRLFNKEDKDDEINICKLDAEKRIVTGIVHDPYIVDAHGDWIPPNEMENIAYEYMENFRKIKDRHRDVMGKSKAVVVESWIEKYPTTADYKAAIAGKPHDIFRIKHGKDFVNSGSWVMSMKIHDDQMWNDIKSGKIKAFSLGGEGKRKPVTRAEMPKVKKVIEIDGADHKVREI